VRWAKGGTPGASFVASAMMLVLGLYAPAIKPPQQEIEEARQDKGKMGSESGDPPYRDRPAHRPGGLTTVPGSRTTLI
jgi:hypothetical protein